MERTQIWVADYLPAIIPDFVNPKITIDHYWRGTLKGCRFYVFEVDPDHEDFCNCKKPDGKAIRVLRACGFKKPRKIYQGCRSEMFLEFKHPPPCISFLTVPKI